MRLITCRELTKIYSHTDWLHIEGNIQKLEAGLESNITLDTGLSPPPGQQELLASFSAVMWNYPLPLLLSKSLSSALPSKHSLLYVHLASGISSVENPFCSLTHHPIEGRVFVSENVIGFWLVCRPVVFRSKAYPLPNSHGHGTGITASRMWLPVVLGHHTLLDVLPPLWLSSGSFPRLCSLSRQ